MRAALCEVQFQGGRWRLSRLDRIQSEDQREALLRVCWNPQQKVPGRGTVSVPTLPGDRVDPKYQRSR